MNKKLNGSVNILADAMRKVFTEAVQEGIKPVGDKIDGLEIRMGNMESNVQAQLAQNRKDVAKDFKRELAKR